MTELIEKLNPPGISKKRRGSLFRIIGRVGDTVNSDMNKVSRSFFPFLCDESKLKRHAAALNILQFPNESTDDFRTRVASGGKWMEERGLREQFYSILDSIVPGRYDVFEAPKNSFRVGFSQIGVDRIGNGTFIVIKVRDLQNEDYDRLFSILDNILDPDIEIIIIPWITANLSDLTLDQIRLYGGSKWLATQYSDICYLDVRLLPDDAFTIGSSRLGYSIVYGSNQQSKILIFCEDIYIQSVSDRTETLLENTIQWEVIQK